ncbi:MAG: hypothetical protein ACR2FF_01640 [Mycobacteriales bacterium]
MTRSRVHRRAFAVGIAGLAVMAGIAGCSSTTAGNGTGPPPSQPTGSAPSGSATPTSTPTIVIPDQPSSASTSSSVPPVSPTSPTTPTTLPSSPTSTTPTTRSPHPPPPRQHDAPPPAGCPNGTCTELSHSSPKDGFQIVLRKAANYATGGELVVELRSGTSARQWALITQTYSGAMHCSTKTEHLHCVVVASVGAHSYQAQLYLVNSGALVAPPPIAADSGIVVRDLDGDGDLDVLAEDSNYKPSYADGGLYWATYLLQNGTYARTGCTTPVYNAAPPTPAGAVHGSCPN